MYAELHIVNLIQRSPLILELVSVSLKIQEELHGSIRTFVISSNSASIFSSVMLFYGEIQKKTMYPLPLDKEHI